MLPLESTKARIYAEIAAQMDTERVRNALITLVNEPTVSLPLVAVSGAWEPSARGFLSYPPFVYNIPREQFDTIEGRIEVLEVLAASCQEKIEADGSVDIETGTGTMVAFDITGISIFPDGNYHMEGAFVPLSVVLS